MLLRSLRPTKITEVVVYPDLALISRVTSLKLKKGDYKIIFVDIIPEIDENSLRVSAYGEAEVKLFGAKLKREYLEELPSERIKQLNEEIQRLKDEIRRQQGYKNLLSEQKNFLDSIRLFSQGQIPKDSDEMLKFLDSKLKENFSAM